MKRIAPEGGYIGTDKEVFRRQMWNVLMRGIPSGLAYNTSVLFLPSSEAREIQIAMDRNIRCSNMYVVDDNPSIMAHIKRKYPLVHTYGVSLSRAAERISKAGAQIKLANLDLCYKFGNPLLLELVSTVKSGIFDSGAIIGVNMLRGRESGTFFSALDVVASSIEKQDFEMINTIGLKLKSTDIARILLVMSIAFGGFAKRIVGSGIYHSTAGSQTMLWFAFLAGKIKDSERWFANINDPRWRDREIYLDTEAACSAALRALYESQHGPLYTSNKGYITSFSVNSKLGILFDLKKEVS